MTEILDFKRITAGVHDGWCTPEKAEALYELVLKADSQITVELGVFAGKSLIPMALAHKEKKSGFIIGIDAYSAAVCAEGSNSELNNDWWKNKVDLQKIYHQCIDNIRRFYVDDYATIVKMRSQDAANIMFRTSHIDIIHQDSNHNPETILAEAKAWTPLLKQGGYWIADDTDWIEAREAYAQLINYDLVLIDDRNTWQIWQKK